MEKKNKQKLNHQLVADVYNLEGKIVEKISLPQEIFSVKASPVLLAQAVRVYLANQRVGTRSTKTRATVRGSTRKIYRQKGTGRARHGDIKAPIFIGGGIAHGPKPSSFLLSFPKKMKRKALFGALTERFENKQMKIVDGLEKISPKTRKMVEVLTALELFQKKEKKPKKILLILEGKRENVLLSTRNLPFLSLTFVPLLNSYQVLSSDFLLLTKEAIAKLIQFWLKKNEEIPAKSRIKENPREAVLKEKS